VRDPAHALAALARGRLCCQLRADEPERPLNDEPRGLSAPLLFAILAMAPVFIWLPLRRVDSRDLRVEAFLYAFLLPAVKLIVLLGATAGER
jgi:hypothetical protein